MSAYDDAETSCPMCTTGIDAASLCECPDEPMCVRCHRAYHVEHRWTERNGQISADLTRRALSTLSQTGGAA